MGADRGNVPAGFGLWMNRRIGNDRSGENFRRSQDDGLGRPWRRDGFRKARALVPKPLELGTRSVAPSVQ